MRDICREAGLSLGGVYVHFESKEALMAALAAVGREKTQGLLAPEPREGERPVADLLDSLLRQLNDPACVESARLDLRLWGEALHTDAVKRQVVHAFQNVRAPFEDAVRREQRKGGRSGKDRAEAGARVLLAIVLGLAVQKAIEPKVDVEKCASFTRSLLAERPPGARKRR